MKIEFNYLTSLKDKLYFFHNFSEIFYYSFKQKYFKSVYSWKYLDNQTSDSIIQQIIVDKKIVGYRGLWKVNNYPLAYQCIDTCIDPLFQGRGIFKLSNNKLKEDLGCFYNYPNKKSSPGYLNSGWSFYASMDIYINKINNFECCDWGQDFLHWRFSQHPYINYYKTKTKNGYAVLRYKKSIPIHVESTNNDIDLEEVNNPLYVLKYDLKKNGIKLKNAGSILGFNFNEELRSSYFDMI